MTGIHSKAATQEYRDNFDRIFGKRHGSVIDMALCTGCGVWVDSVDENRLCKVCAPVHLRGCANCAVDGNTCECDQAVCHVPSEDEAKSLMAGVDMMPVSEEDK